MTNQALCHECGSLLNVSGAIVAPTDVDNARPITAEPRYSTEIVCPSDTCPSRFIPHETFGFMETVQMEQAGDLGTVDSREIVGAQQPQLSNNDFPQQQEQQELEDLEKTLQVELEIFLNDPLQQVDGKPIHQGRNPCRVCYRKGIHCCILPGSKACTSCQGTSRPSCNKSLAGAKAGGFWSKRTLLDYSPPFSIHASRISDGSDGGDVLEYNVNYPFKPGRPSWVAAENLKEYTWMLKKFHHDKPRMPGPAEWLVVEEDDEFFYGDSNHLPM